VIPTIIDGIDSVRMNAHFEQEIPQVDLIAKDTVVPLKYATSLLLAPSSELQIGNLIVGLEVSPVGVHKLGFVFEVIQVVCSSVGIPNRIVVRRADILDQGCPLMLQFDVKTDDKVWCFNAYGVQALIHTLGASYYFNNNDTSKLIGFVSASTKPIVIAAPASGIAARPVTASLADQIVAGTALKNLIGPNVPVTEVLFPSDCLTISGHSVNSVLNSIEPGSALLQSVLAYPGVLLVLMGVSFGPFQNTVFPKDTSAKPQTISYLWAAGYDGTDVLSNEIVVNGVEITTRWFDVISQKVDPSSGRGWYISLFRPIFDLFSRFSPKNVLSFSPAFNSNMMQDIFAKIEAILKRPVPVPRTKPQLDLELINLISGYTYEYCLSKYREFQLVYPQEAEAWTQCCQSDPEVQRVLPKFSGPSMAVPVLPSAAGSGAPGPPTKKPKPSKPRKPKVSAAAPVVVSTFVPPPPPLPAPGGSNTRGKSASLCMKNCKYHVKALFLNYAACHYGTKCSGTHQIDVKSFSKTEMCNWVDATCKSESDYVALRAAIVSKA